MQDKLHLIALSYIIGEKTEGGLPRIRTVWQKQDRQEPEIVESFNPDRTTLVLPKVILQIFSIPKEYNADAVCHPQNLAELKTHKETLYVKEIKKIP